MSGILSNSSYRVLIAASALIAARAHADTVSRMSSRFLARGEQSLLEVAVTDNQQISLPVIPEVPGLDIKPQAMGRLKQFPGRPVEFVFEYVVSSYQTGSHTLPAIEVLVGGVRTRTEPIEFTVFNPDELQWSEAEVGNTRFRYACAFRTSNSRPFKGETTPVEIKLYVPRDLFIDDYGIPDFERDGLTAWRFQPNPARGLVNLLGLPYQAVAYPSTFTPTRSGGVGIGPAKVRLVTRLVELDGIQRWVNREVFLSVPKLEAEARPLPPGAPDGFDNAVGDFRLAARVESAEVQEGDPVQVVLEISGTGNLDTLSPPKPAESAGWKLYAAAAEPRGEERREPNGTVRFRQFMRPLELKAQVPAFRMVYFDPKSESYKTLLSDPIPLDMKAAPAPKAEALAPPPTLAVPVERMTDILGLIDTPRLVLPDKSGIPGWIWHALAGLAAVILIAKALWMRHAHRFHRDPVREARLRELRELENLQSGDDAGFLMAAGRFIERWLGADPAAELQEVLRDRDQQCFRRDQESGRALAPERRRQILGVLRKAAMLWLAAFLLGGGQARAADTAAQARTAYDAARYDEAIGLWLKAGPYQKLSADTLYNIGNACYRAGSPGHAALYYRRALVREPGHEESRQNLRFIERKYGSITVHRPEYQYALAKLPLTAWKGMLWAGAWMCALALLVFPATRSGARPRLAAVVALVVGPLLATSGALGWRYYPNDAEFASLGSQAVIIAEQAVLHSDASRAAPEVIDAPPGSLCEVVRESGRWAYIAFATKTRGWIPVEMIEKVEPETPPAPPKIRKPKADGKSA